jgi:hypothetical protein
MGVNIVKNQALLYFYGSAGRTDELKTRPESGLGRQMATVLEVNIPICWYWAKLCLGWESL